MQRMNTQAVADKLAARMRSTVTAALVDFKPVNAQLARVVMTFNTLEANRGDFHDAVCAALKGQATPVAGSFRALASYGNPAMVGYVTAQAEVRPYEEAAAKNMVALASNMLMDSKDNSLWNVTSDGSGGKMLCRESADTLTKLLETARVHAPRSPRLANVMAGVDTGNFVAYVDPITAKLRHGYVLATDAAILPPVDGNEFQTIDDELPGVEILPLPEQDACNANADNQGDELNGENVEQEEPTVVVHAALIVESAAMNGADRSPEVAAPNNALNKASLIDYYGRLYAHAPDFYKEVKQIIETHAGF